MRSSYEIRFARLDEQQAMRDFIETHWRSGHILARSAEVFDWQYRNEACQRYNFVVGIETDTKEIHGVLGFIPVSHFDPELEDQREIWLAVWKVREDRETSGLGLSMLMKLKQLSKAKSIGLIGLSEDSRQIFRALRYTCGNAEHYYLVNPERTTFKILGGFDDCYAHERAANDPLKRIVRLDNDDIPTTLKGIESSQLADQQRPYKTATYFLNRYARHPFYQYQMWSIANASHVAAVLVTRRVVANDSAVLRIIDIYGATTAIEATHGEFCKMLATENAEYIDFYNSGLLASSLETAGFLSRHSSSQVIVPNYFEPFEQKNVDLAFAYWTQDRSPYEFVKGDSDQDRPSAI
ncbi:hypothetical protein SH528x_000257 [Novipirellula sp. SH528]|uniref:hypothetical protein n=1 Tax=Novipirellula sp. SH528 TaxID=3454466 RepID=UPI003FA00A00